MRPADIALMAIASLWRQRGRTLLTLVGVTIGCLILLFSLSARRGVEDAVVQVFDQSDAFRRIEIFPRYSPVDSEIPLEAIEPKGEMDSAKRERIRRMLKQQWRQDHQRERTGITRERLAELETIDHVVRVVPEVLGFGWMVSGENQAESSLVGVPADSEVLRERIVAGSGFPSDADDGVLIHEYLAYRWGFVSDEELKNLVGRKARFEVRVREELLASTLAYRNGRELNLTPEETASLNRAFDRLPGLLDETPLPDDEREALRKAFPPPATEEEPPARTPTERVRSSKEFVIRGVFRAPTEDEEQAGIRISEFYSGADVLVPIDTAKDFYYGQLDATGYGLSQATVVVDDEAHLSTVSTRLGDMGYYDRSLIRIVERINSYVSVVTLIIAVVAGIALFVAAIGIMNTMIMSVLERTHEIGVMKSVGARDGHILSIFLAEGGLIGVLGGVLSIGVGLLMSIGVEWAIREILEREIYRSFDEVSVLKFTWWMFAVVVAVSGLVTMLAAVIPARRAARISPVAALRHDG